MTNFPLKKCLISASTITSKCLFLFLFCVWFGLFVIVCFIVYLHCLSWSERLYLEIYKYMLEEAPFNLDERRVKIFSNYFHEEISSVFPIKICYFDKGLGTWLTAILLYLNAIAYLPYVSAPALVSGRNSIQHKHSRYIFVLYRWK